MSKLHHYIFQAYALNIILNINEGPTVNEVEKALQGHIIAQTKLVGTYQKLTLNAKNLTWLILVLYYNEPMLLTSSIAKKQTVAITGFY